MGNLLSLYPKIHRLNTDAKKPCGVPDGERQFATLCFIHESRLGLKELPPNYWLKKEKGSAYVIQNKG
jgi:hypothetical protein